MAKATSAQNGEKIKSKFWLVNDLRLLQKLQKTESHLSFLFDLIILKVSSFCVNTARDSDVKFSNIGYALPKPYYTQAVSRIFAAHSSQTHFWADEGSVLYS